MKISFVIALTRSGVMGKNNALPWHLPEDLKHFKELTSGKPVLMGRKTYESIGRPLPARRNIILSRQKDLQIPGVECVTSLEEALTRVAGSDELCIIGGAEILHLAQDLVTDLHFTWIEKEFDGDIRFNLKNFPWQNFEELSREAHVEGAIPYTFVDYRRKDLRPRLDGTPQELS